MRLMVRGYGCLLVAASCASIAAGAVPAAQQQQQQQPPPRFRAGIDLTRVEVTVLHKDTRKPIRGLKADDFLVKVDGRDQRVATLAEVDVPGVSATVTPVFVEAPYEAVANDRRSPRVFIIVMDDAAGGTDPFIRKTGKEVGHRLIDALGPEDMAAVVFVRDNSHAQDLTADRTLLRRAVERFNPMRTIGVSGASVVRRAHRFLLRMPGYRRALMFVSAGAPARIRTEETLTLESFDPALQAISTARGVGHVPIYTFGLAGLLAPTAADLRQGQLQHPAARAQDDRARTVAQLTGGRAIVATNAPAAAVAAVFEELSSYYVLAYESSVPLDRRHRWLDVDVRHPDAMVHPSRLLIAPTPPPQEGFAVADRPEDSGLLDAIAAPLPVGDVPLRLASAVVAIPAKREHAVVLTLGLPPVPPGTVEAFRVRLMLFDSEGRRELLTETHDVKVPGRQRTDGDPNEMVVRLNLRPDRYHLRIAGERLSTRQTGSVHATLVVPDFHREPLALSGVVVSRAGGTPPGGREAITDLLPSVPTAARTLNRTDHVSAWVRVHQSMQKAPAAVVLETSIIDAAGGQAYTGTRNIAADAFTSAAGVEHRFDLPLATLEPGDYLLRFIASTDTHRAQRDVRFTVER